GGWQVVFRALARPEQTRASPPRPPGTHTAARPQSGSTCVTNCNSASWPNGAATGRKRATSANSKPIIASPTNPSDTAKWVQNPGCGWLAPMAGKTSGDTTAPTYAITQNTARTASFIRAAPGSSSARRTVERPRSPEHDDGKAKAPASGAFLV